MSLFWADERIVPPEHELSNFLPAFHEMISKVPIPGENIHRIRGELSPEDAAQEYEEALRAKFGENVLPSFDLIMLGVGQDGHTASLFPRSGALSETERLALPVYDESSGLWRVTLTLPVLNNARHIVFLVSGKSKSGIIREILGRGGREPYPAGLVRPVNGRVTWLLDADAACLLSGS